MPHPRRPHQVAAINDVVVGFERHDRGQLIMACGTGKTLTSLWIAEDMDSELTLVLVPSIGLLDQFASEWRDNCADRYRYATLCVCSDSTIGAAGSDEDRVDFSTTDLIDHGFDVSADVAHISTFMSAAGRKVIFCTYQSSHLIASAQADALIPSFDLAIADEAHRCAGSVDGVFATIVDGNLIRAKKRLFATATPRIYKRSGRRSDAAREVVDMNDEKLFGPRLHSLSFGKAIQLGLLSDYRVVVILIDDAEVQALLQRFESSSLHRSDNEVWRCATQVGLLKAMQQFDLRRVISFHHHVSGALKFANELPAVARAMWADAPSGSIPFSDHVSGAMSASERKGKLHSFGSTAGHRRLMTNARCLTEGVDVPGIDGVAFVDPRRSEIDIIQALGRAIRRHKNKEFGTIVLPVFLGTGDTVDEVIGNTEFRPVWDVLNALRAHDGDFEMELRQRRQAQGAVSKDNAAPLPKIEWVGSSRVIGFSKALQPILVDKLTDSWEEGFGAATAYWKAHGNIDAPGDTRWPDSSPKAFPLGRWLDTQRYMRSIGKLSCDRTDRLSALGLIWNQIEAAWEEGYASLSAWHASHGHSRVPRDARWPEDDPTGFKLGMWVRGQRVAHKDGRLSDVRYSKLRSLCFVWDSHAAAWDEAFTHAQSWCAVHDSCNPPQGATWPEGDPKGFGLGAWLNAQRIAKRNGQLSANRVEKLDGLGVVWNPAEDAWEDAFGHAVAWHERHGHCNVPQRATWPESGTDASRLGHWIDSQRAAYFKGTLDSERTRRLEALGITWDPLQAAWDQAFATATEWCKAFGYLGPKQDATWPTGDPNGFRIGMWVNSQRKARRAGRLSLERVARLDSLGIVWEPRLDRRQRHAQLDNHSAPSSYGSHLEMQRLADFPIPRAVHRSQNLARKTRRLPERRAV